MAKQKKYQLSEVELSQLEKLIRCGSQAKIVKRATALRQLHLGKTPAQVAQIFAVSKATIYRWWKLWQAEGVDGLKPVPRPGRPPKADEAYWQEVEATLAQEPRVFGYAFTIWTTERLRQHLEKTTKVRLSAEWLRQQMKRRGYVYRRPKKDLRVLQDPQARAEAEQWLSRLKKAPWPARSSYSLWTKAP